MIRARGRAIRTTLFLAALSAQYIVLIVIAEFIVRLELSEEEVRPCQPLLALGLLVVIKVGIATGSCLRQISLSRTLRSMVRSSSADASHTQALIDRSGLRNRVTVIDEPSLVACTSGLFRTRVIISTGLVDRLTTGQLEAVLRHEESHANAADPLLYLLIDVTRRMFFYLPAVCGALERLLTRRELAADAHAVEVCGVGPLAGALLIALKEQPPAGQTGIPALWPALAGPGGLLESRLEQLETGRAPLPGRLPRRSLLWTLPGVIGLSLISLWILQMCAVCFGCADC
ncbi:M56 family metallopeptidase [Streptomyces sp. So13.3]|uniref:M56 family metallopeptidase n=1 Tax=unclassified Streptomyces TaxID=2593676 RepID=UPI00164D4916|nr:MULTISPECIES: M56 family metallopeptidase [unclassified Streptomyces]MCZ4101615.1 M56 family metallopeptidase [Streptomyces sp. H39-C1]QNA76366.1 M56 family metallopeptidase [Streptomyces sp. So13.3]